jgi:myo-inositol-1(or 4)-monophosphatase
MPISLEQICRQVIALTTETGKFIRTQVNEVKQKDIKVKGLHDFVTYVDKTSEKMLVSKLSEILPEAGFITEEKTIEKTGETYQWVVDPLDGTTNFIHAIPCYSISIALLKNNIPVLGVVHELNLNECFYTWEGAPAYMNGNQIKVSEISDVEDSLIATGFPYNDYENLEKYLEVFRYFLLHSHGIRRLGSAAVDLAYVACGRFECFYEYGLKSWDVAAGALIVKNAGGRLSDFSGNDNYIFGKEIVSGNSAVFDEILGVVKKYFEN